MDYCANGSCPQFQTVNLAEQLLTMCEDYAQSNPYVCCWGVRAAERVKKIIPHMKAVGKKHGINFSVRVD